MAVLAAPVDLHRCGLPNHHPPPGRPADTVDTPLPYPGHQYAVVDLNPQYLPNPSPLEVCGSQQWPAVGWLVAAQAVCTVRVPVCLAPRQAGQPHMVGTQAIRGC